MKNLLKVCAMFIAFGLFTNVANAQNWDYISKGTGTSGTPLEWYSASSWFLSDGVTTASSAPTSTSRVKISANDTLRIDSLAANCSNLEVDGTVLLKNTLNCDTLVINSKGNIKDIGCTWCGDWSGSYIYAGINTKTPLIHVDGVLGTSDYSGDGIHLCPKIGVSNFTVEGNGIIAIRSFFPESANDTTTSDMNILINANMTLRANLDRQSWGNQNSSLSLQSGSPFNNNRILTIAAGKKVTIPGLGSFHTRSGDTTSTGTNYQTQGNCTYNILGTLDFSCEINGGRFYISTNATSWGGQSQIVQVAIKSGGILRFGGKGTNVSNIGIYTNSASWGHQKAQLISESGSTIEFYGNASPIFSSGYGTNGDSTLPTFAKSIDSLIINDSAGVSLPNDITIKSVLNLKSGNLILNTHNLTLDTLATISGGSASSYIQTDSTSATGGFVTANVGSKGFTFPIGNSNYTPSTLVNSGNVMNFSLRNFEDVLDNGTSGNSILATGKVKKTWVINSATPSGANVALTLQWNGANSNMLDNANCFIAQNIGGDGQSWIATETPLAASGTDSFTQTVSGITSFSNFSVLSNLGILPVTFISVNGNIQNNSAIVNWKVAKQQVVSNYIIEKSSDGLNFTPIGNKIPSIVSGTIAYQFVDNNFSQKAYYRITSVNLDGTKQFSKVVFLINNIGNNNFSLAANPSKSNFKLLSKNIPTSILNVVLVSQDGRVLGKVSGNLDAVNSSLNTLMQVKSNGVYYLKIIEATNNQTLKLMKQ